MRVVHRIGISANPAQRAQLEALGVSVSSGGALASGGSLLAFEVDEGHPNWEALSVLFQLWQASDVVRTEFSKEEVRSAEWLEISAWHHGYPQPDEGSLGYRRVTYDLSVWCEACGIGMAQKAPFQMTGEPAWGRKAILQLVWIYGELFVTPNVWRTVFEPAQVGCRAVFDTHGTELRTVVQLVVDATTSIVTEGLANERCGRCARVKYLPVTRGRFPALRDMPTSPIVRTVEYFGSGAQADQRLLISQELARWLDAGGVRGASLMPVAPPVLDGKPN